MRYQKLVFSLICLTSICFIVHGQPTVTKDLPAFTVNVSESLGSFKPLNGVNGGPRIRLGNFMDNSEYFKEFEPPYVRIHDSRYAEEDVVDIHTIFPDFSADENDPASYQFERTDIHIKSILDVGSKVIFRLGESIEKGEIRYYIHPPADFEKWARICCNIVRHYNMAWADGFRWDIKHWEIWNEAEHDRCWLGTWEEYCLLYETTARALKELDPHLKVGGPAIGAPMETEEGKEFLRYCRDHKVPIDFISFHTYRDHPQHVIDYIESTLTLIEEYGFKNIETHFTEWNYVAPGAWSSNDRKTIRDAFMRTHGGPGAAFAASVLAYMQETELDIACFYAAFGSIFRFGFFDRYGAPTKQYYTFKAFNELVRCGTRLEVSGNKRETGVGIVAAVNEKTGKLAVLISNFEDEASRYTLEMKNIPLKEQLVCSEFVIDDERELELDREQIINGGNLKIIVELPRESVRLIIIE